MFAIKKDIIIEALKDPEFRAKWDKLNDTKDMQKLLAEYCRKKGYVVKDVPI